MYVCIYIYYLYVFIYVHIFQYLYIYSTYNTVVVQSTIVFDYEKVYSSKQHLGNTPKNK